MTTLKVFDDDSNEFFEKLPQSSTTTPINPLLDSYTKFLNILNTIFYILYESIQIYIKSFLFFTYTLHLTILDYIQFYTINAEDDINAYTKLLLIRILIIILLIMIILLLTGFKWISYCIKKDVTNDIIRKKK